MDVICFLLLSCVGLAGIAQAQDCPRPVGGANMELSPGDITLTSFPEETRVTFVCVIGYQAAVGSGATTCTSGTWSPLKLVCEKKSCGSAGEVENGDIDYSNGIEFGDKVIVTCNPGFILVGNNELLCGDQGWLGRLPVCEAVTCDPPRTVQNATFSPEKDVYQFREAVIYSCKNGWTMSGSSTLTCSLNGIFTPNPPTCTFVQCDEPNVPNGEWFGGSRPPYGYQAVVKYRCSSGYELVGESSLTCGLDSQWAPGIPTCKARTCPQPTVTNGAVTPNKPAYSVNEAVSYTCNEGYTLQGSTTSTCSSDGTLRPNPPTCTKTPTTTPTTTTPTTTTPTTTTTTTSATQGPKPDECTEPRIQNAEKIGGSQPPYKYKSTLTYKCKSGHNMEGQPTQTCERNGQWSPGLPECQPNKGHVVEIVVGVLAALVLLVAAFFGYRKWKQSKGSGKAGAHKKATKTEEAVAFSSRDGRDKIAADAEAGSPMESRSNNV